MKIIWLAYSFLLSCVFFFLNTKQDQTYNDLMCNCSREADSLVLVELHSNSSLTEPWVTDWTLTDSLNNWPGVLLNEEGCVRALFLQSNNLNGTLSASIGELCALEILDFSQNFKLKGELPGEIGALPDLQIIDFWNTGFVGQVPNSFASLSKIIIFLLGSPSLDDSFPSEIFGMTSLVQLDLLGGFSGEVPDSFQSFPDLKFIQIIHTDLTGNIPNTLTAINSLKHLVIHNNNFTGALPDLSNLDLTKLEIHNNKLENIFDLSQIETWESPPIIRENKLTFEDILPSISVFPAGAGWEYYNPQDSVLNDTILYVNNLGDDILFEWDFDQDLEFPNDYIWFKYGVPTSQVSGGQLSFENVTIDDIGIYSFEASNVWTVPGLTLYSRNIHVVANLPCQEADSLELVKLYNSVEGLDWNLEDPMPLWTGIHAPTGCVEKIDISNSDLSGQLPELMLPDLTEFKANGNPNLTGAIPSFSGSPQLEYLYLNNCGFTNDIPYFEALESLKILDLSGNVGLSDTIPDFVLPTLENLVISNCSLIGNIPKLTGSPNLKDLWLANNNLTGSIPAFTQPMFWISLSNNQLDYLPANLNISGLAGLFVDNNKLSDSIPHWPDAPILSNLVLHHNNFTYLPDYSQTPFSFVFDQGLSVHHNQLSFDDIIPNRNITINSLGSFTYIPQDSFLSRTEVFIPLNETYTIFLGIDQGIENNNYKWFKNGDSLTVVNENFFEITSENEIRTDTFHCQVTNPLIAWPVIADLTLYTRATIVHTCQPHETNINLTLCDEDAFIFNGTTYNQDNPEGMEYIDVSNELGCDSIYHIALDFYPRSEKIIIDSISEGSFIEVAGTNYDSTGTYEIILVEQGYTGCDSIIQLDLTVSPSNTILEKDFPNSFTPNNDGLNDFFVIPALQSRPQDFENPEFLVFNRENQMIFQAKPYQNNWNGNSDNGALLPTGTYYYVFRYIENGESVITKGKILLNR